MRKATSAECQNIQMQRGKVLHQAALFSSSQAPGVWRDRGMLGQLHQHLDVWRCGATMKDGVLSFTAVSLTTPPPPPCFCMFCNFYIGLCVSCCKPRKYNPCLEEKWHRIIEVRTLRDTGQWVGQENDSLFLGLRCKIVLLGVTDSMRTLKKAEDESVENYGDENNEDLFMTKVGHGEMNHRVNVRAGTSGK